jgi:hypothetical protein
MISRYVLLFGIIIGSFLQTSEIIFMHKLDTISLQNLYEVIKPPEMENPMPFSTDNRAQYEYWQLAHRIESTESLSHIFTNDQQACFNELTAVILECDSYQKILKRAQKNEITWDRFRHIGAIIAKIKLVKVGIKYYSNSSQNTFDQFLKANENISIEVVPWMIADTMFFYYLQQIERSHTIIS